MTKTKAPPKETNRQKVIDHLVDAKGKPVSTADLCELIYPGQAKAAGKLRMILIGLVKVQQADPEFGYTLKRGTDSDGKATFALVKVKAPPMAMAASSEPKAKKKRKATK